MAEKKVTLVELDIDMKSAIQDTVTLKQNLVDLAATAKKAKESDGELSASYIEAATNLKVAQGELRTQETLLKNVTTANTVQVGSMQQMKAQLSVVSAQWNKLSEDERLNTEEGKKLSAQKLELTNALKKEEISTGDARRNVGNYGDQVGAATGALTQLVPGVGAASSAVKIFGTVLKVAMGPLGIIIAAVAAMYEYFTRAEEGQNKLSKAMKVFGVVLENIMDVVSSFGELLVSVVEKPKQAWEGLKNSIKAIGDFFSNTFGNIIGGAIDAFVASWSRNFAAVGLAWQKFKGLFVDNSEKIKASQKSIEDANNRIKDAQDRIALGANNLKDAAVNAYHKVRDALGNYIDENQREIEIAKRLADSEANLRKQERADIVENAKLAKESADLRAKAEELKLTNAKKSIELYNKAFDLDEKALRNELAIAKTKAANAKLSASLSNSNIETLDNVAKLEADVEQKSAALNAKKRDRQTMLNTLYLQAFAQDQVRQKALLELDKISTNEKIKNNQTVLNDWRSTNEEKTRALEENVNLQNAIISKDAKLQRESIEAQVKFHVLSEEDAAIQIDLINKKAAESSLDVLRQSIEDGKKLQDEERQRRIEAEKADLDNRLELLNNNVLAEFEIQSAQLAQQSEAELAAADKTGADKTLILKKWAAAEKKIEQSKFQAQLGLYADFAANIATIAGKNTAIGRAAAVASTLINTYASATAAYKSLAGIPVVGPALGIAAAAAAVVSGLASVKQILSVKSGLPGDSSSSSASGGASSTVTPAVRSVVNPEIGQGIVSRSASQADSNSVRNGVLSANADSSPIVAVVVDDVTSKQNLQQNIKANAQY